MILAVLAALIGCAGLLQAAIGHAFVRRFAAQFSDAGQCCPPVSVLKPLYGEEPQLEQALASLCVQDCGEVQIVLGVQDSRDPALLVVERVRRRFPEVEITLVVDPTPHGSNRKVANLINMLPAARHDILVIADSDIHAPPGYLTALVTALQQPDVGVATTVYTGLPTNDSVAAKLGATGLTHSLLPGALMARALGREDCLGATVALRRQILDRIGGFAPLIHQLADDHVLGELVQAQGLRVALAATVPATSVTESDLATLYRHELRWARTIAAIVPFRFALSTVQYPLAWAGLAAILSGGNEAALAVFLVIWIGRAVVCRGIDQSLAQQGRPGLASPAPIWLLPLRDMLSFGVTVASYLGDEVVWRGHVMRSGRAGLTPRKLGTEPP